MLSKAFERQGRWCKMKQRLGSLGASGNGGGTGQAEVADMSWCRNGVDLFSQVVLDTTLGLDSCRHVEVLPFTCR